MSAFCRPVASAASAAITPAARRPPPACSDEDAQTVLGAMSGSEQANRVLFFEAALSARRRARQSWAGTPVRTIFNFGDGEAFGALLATVAKVRSAVAAAGVDLVRCCEEADEDGNGFLDASEIVAVFDVRLRLGQCCAGCAVLLCCAVLYCVVRPLRAVVGRRRCCRCRWVRGCCGSYNTHCRCRLLTTEHLGGRGCTCVDGRPDEAGRAHG